MKLYTEEQVIEMLIQDNIFDVDDILDSQKPIELPTDEDIEKLGAELFDKVIYIDYEWIMGAKWMRDRILNK